MKKEIAKIISIFFFIVAPCALLQNANAQDIKIATLAPEGTTWMVALRQGAEEITRRTSGRVNILLYPGGIMGNDNSMLRKMRVGQLQGAALTGGALAQVYPDNQIYNIPFAFRSFEEVDYVRKRIDAIITKGLEKRNLISFGIAEAGFAYMMSTQPIESLAELKTKKVWIPENDTISQLALQALDVTPIQLPLTDVLVGLQTGLISTIASSPTGAIAFQWHTKIKYVVDVPVMYLYGMFVIDKRAFNRMSAQDRKIVHEVMSKAIITVDKRSREDNKGARAALQQQGIQFTQLMPEDTVTLRQTSEAIKATLLKKNIFSSQMLDTINQALSAFRRPTSALSTK